MRSCPLKGERIISHTPILPGGEPSPFHAASVPSGRSSRTVKLMAVHVVHVDQARIGHTLSSKVSHHTSEIQPAAHGTFAVMSQLVHNLLFLCTLIWAGPRPVDPGRSEGFRALPALEFVGFTPIIDLVRPAPARNFSRGFESRP